MAKKAQPAKKSLTAVRESFSKTEILSTISESTGLTRKDVSNVLDELTNVMARHIKPRAIGEFKFPGLFKVKTVRKPATKARKGINPFTGEETVFKAKPARTVVKVLPLKKMKEMVQ